MTPEGKVKYAIANLLAKSDMLFGRRVFYWYNSSTGIFDPKSRQFRRNSSPFAIKGTGDILGLLDDGTFISIEVKSAKGKLSPFQIDFLTKVRDMGGIAIVCYSSLDFLEKFRKSLLARKSKVVRKRFSNDLAH